MIIKSASKNYFSFKLHEKDLSLIEKDEFFDELKNLIPAQWRKYFPDRHAWYIHQEFFGEFIKFLFNYPDLFINYLSNMILKQESLF